MSSTSSGPVPIEEFPDSVEEAAALLGATITLCGKSTAHKAAALPPTGMHPAFAVTKAASELVSRLYILRSMLRSAKANSDDLPAAPSILQVLKKLLGVSTSLAAVAAANASTVGSEPVKVSKSEHRMLILKHKHETPPMLSTPCRQLWVDCVVLCFSFQKSSDLTQFVRQMLALASIHPRSAKAAGGVRIAALAVVAALFEYDDDDYKMASQLAPWSLDVLHVCLKALRSAGNGEPTYREAAIRAACATATACQHAAWKNRKETAVSERDALLLQGAMEEKAVAESIRVLRQAVTDKFPEVRMVAATFAAVLAPLLVPLSGDAFTSLDEVLTLATKNLDDESPVVADGWAEALARCMSTAIQYNENSSQVPGARKPEGGAGGSPAKAEVSQARFGARKTTGLAHSLDSVKTAVQYLVSKFIKAGGELAAPRGGGSFSIGGRSVRLGYSVTLSRFLRLQCAFGSVGESRGISYKDAIISVLRMVGNEIDRQLKSSVTGESAANPLFGGGRSRSKTDGGLVRLSASRVLRHGISDLNAEPVQISILQEYILLLPSADVGQQSSADTPTLNANQIQVVLNEISHLLSTLGEGAASRVEEIAEKLKVCLSHEDLGVRHEAAVVCAALAASFPSDGRKFVGSCVEDIQHHHAKLVSAASTGQNKVDEQGGGLRMFRRATKEKMNQTDSALQDQFAIHGRALVVSILVKDLTQLPGGLPREVLGTVLAVAQILVSCQFNDILTSSNADAVCSCVRAGFCLISGILSCGPDVVETHMPLIVGTWQKAVKVSKDGVKQMNAEHDLICLEAVLCSIVAFLQFCSELLLVIPEALSQVTVLLEDAFPLIQPNGRLSSVPLTPLAAARLESATASLLEAFAWLPSGSFPMVADEIFAFAAVQIRKAVEEHVSCSILHSLVSKEDSILDSKTLSRAKRDGQVGGARDIEESIIFLTAEVSLHDERESVMHLRSHEPVGLLNASSTAFRGSSILELFASDMKLAKAPTPLHEVGTWRRPFDPSVSAKIRIVDAAIQAFSAIFGLKDGKEQQGAMNMLESLVPPLLTQLARTVGINASLVEQDWRAKVKEDSAAETIITAVLLSCLQALPLHEATHNVPIGLGPPWMNKAKDLLLTLLPSTSTIVRRAAAEGLALLATLGVTEDAHFLQSTLLHSLDEVMQGNKPDGKPRAITLEPISAARAGSLLTLACIQRTAYNVAQRKSARARGRASGSKTSEAIDESNDSLPVLQMMTRILPSAACHGFNDYFAVKTYALYSFAVLLLYSARLNNDPLGDEDMQLLRKAIELVEDNFSSSWTASSADINRGQEAEKMTTEVAFLSVLLRLMTFLVPFLQHLTREDRDIARRFSVMATIMLESHGSHPVIFVESMAFFEVFASHQSLLPTPSRNVIYSENPLFSCIPGILAALTPVRPMPFAQGIWRPDCLMVSRKSLRAAAYMVKVLASSQFSVADWSNMQVVSLLMASLEAVSGTSQFGGGNLLRSVAVSREIERFFFEGIALEMEIFQTLPTLLLLERTFHALGSNEKFLRWILLSRQLLSPSSAGAEDTQGYTRSQVVAAATTTSALDASAVYKMTSQPRWQVKCLAAQLASEALRQIIVGDFDAPREANGNPHFDSAMANKLCSKECSEASDKGAKLPCSKLVFHLEDILASACMSSVATLDHAELRLLQESSMNFLHKLIVSFGSSSDPEEPTASILDQYATQIFSSIKHALAAPEHCDSASSSRLFVAGCRALHAALATKITTDPILLKRLLRPTIPSPDSLPIFSYSDGSSVLKLDSDDSATNVEVRICRLWTAGKFLLSKNTEMEDVAKDLLEDRLGLAVHCAAAAVDGCRLLSSSNLSLAGRGRITENCDGEMTFDCGFHYQNESDVGNSAKEILTMTWSSCCSSAVGPLLDTMSSSNEDENLRELCFTWIKSLYPLLIAGIRDGIVATTEDSQDGGVDWAVGIDAALIVKECLCGMCIVVSSGVEELFDREFGQDLERLLALLNETVLIPCLSSNKSRFKSDVVFEVCKLVCHLAVLDQESAAIIDSSLLVTLLEPLNLLQTGKVVFVDTLADVIISACLAGVSSLVRQGSSTNALVKAALQLILKSIVVPEAELPTEVQDAGKSLLEECLKHKSVSLKEQQQIACSLASSGNWEGWSVISTLNDGEAITQSLDIVQATLVSFDEVESQVAALAAIRCVVQQASAPVVGRLLHKVGSDCVIILYQYATRKIPEFAVPYRTAASADAMKIILTAYQQLSSEEDTDEQVSSFLTVLFEILLAVLRYNGIPNHPSSEPAGDPALGRISAQTILHVARTTPVSFKTCMSTLSDLNRTLLEFAVRAEMSGYATAQQQAPAKKKLSLKGFK